MPSVSPTLFFVLGRHQWEPLPLPFQDSSPQGGHSFKMIILGEGARHFENGYRKRTYTMIRRDFSAPIFSSRARISAAGMAWAPATTAPPIALTPRANQ